MTQCVGCWAGTAITLLWMAVKMDFSDQYCVISYYFHCYLLFLCTVLLGMWNVPFLLTNCLARPTFRHLLWRFRKKKSHRFSLRIYCFLHIHTRIIFSSYATRMRETRLEGTGSIVVIRGVRDGCGKRSRWTEPRWVNTAPQTPSYLLPSCCAWHRHTAKLIAPARRLSHTNRYHKDVEPY